MSWRTLIEINHDQLHVLEGEHSHLKRLLLLLARGDMKPIELGQIPGVRFLGVKHHSEDRTVDWK